MSSNAPSVRILRFHRLSPAGKQSTWTINAYLTSAVFKQISRLGAQLFRFLFHANHISNVLCEKIRESFTYVHFSRTSDE